MIKMVNAVKPAIEFVRSISPAPAAKAGVASRNSKTVVISFLTIFI
jgi:hypothetical protein